MAEETLAEAQARAARWEANYEEKARAYSAVFGELTEAKRRIAELEAGTQEGSKS